MRLSQGMYVFMYMNTCISWLVLGEKKEKCEYTDDTAMLRCVANSLVQHKKLDASDLSKKYLT